MKTISIELDDGTAAWAEACAARAGTTTPRFISRQLRDSMLDERGYDAAYREFRATKPVRLRRAGESWPSRDDTNKRG